MRRLFIAAAALLAAISCSSDRSGVLKVYNWSDYIGEGIISEFEQWYKEQTGEDITVVYQTFDVKDREGTRGLRRCMPVRLYY